MLTTIYSGLTVSGKIARPKGSLKYMIPKLILSLALLALAGCSAGEIPFSLGTRQNKPKTRPHETETRAQVRRQLLRLGTPAATPVSQYNLPPEQVRKLALKQAKFDIPITVNRRVLHFIDYFQNVIPHYFQIYLERSGRYAPVMRRILRKHGLPEDLIYLAMVESGFSCQAYSRARAVGPWQFIASTGRRYGLKINYWVDERRDPIKSTHAAARYLRDLYDEFESWYLAAAAYNAGEGKVRHAMWQYGSADFWKISEGRRSCLRRETKQYVPKMIAAAIIGKQPAKYGFTGLNYQKPFTFDMVEVHPGTSLSAAARILGVNTRVLRELNPELRRGVVPPRGARYRLRIPSGRQQQFLVAYQKLSPRQRRARLDAITVKIGWGDTLGAIARRHRVPLRDLLAMNPHLHPRYLRAGDRVMVPPSRYASRYWRRKARRQSKGRQRYRPDDQRVRVTHVVRRGETLWQIAQDLGITHREIMSWNGLRSSRLTPGSELVLFLPPEQVPETPAAPAGQTRGQVAVRKAKLKKIVHLVRRGDTLWEIAQAYGLRHRDIKRWNGLRSSRLTPGETLNLYLPAEAAVPSADQTASARGRRSSGPQPGGKKLYQVQQGDSLWAISRRFNISVRRLRRLNRLADNRINPGDTIRVR